MRFFSLITILSLLSLLAFVGGCAVNPATGGTDIVLMSESQEIATGKKMHDEIISSNSAYPDERVQSYVNRIGQELAQHSDRPNLNYTFTVIDSENINAFALPGGYVYMNRGLMLYLDNEAELAGVLGHEIGHITARHAVRQQTAAAANSVVASVAYVLTGSADLANASNTAGTAFVRGYGRDHELEADREGATYLHRTGYDPNSLLDVIGVLKDQEQYNRVKAQQSGQQAQTYHGLFATHPRNDARLQKVISTASELEPVPPKDIDNAEFRSVLNGMTYGKRSTVTAREEGRFYHNRLGFTFVEPENWSVNSGSRAIVSKADDGSAVLTLTIKRKDGSVSARSFLAAQLEASKLVQSKPLQQEGLEGYSAVAPATGGKNSRRLAVIYKGSVAYLFEGEVENESDFTIKDAYFNAQIESFRAMQKHEAPSRDAKQIEYIQAQPGLTYAQLARQTKISDAENQLRLLNGQYPRGEPRAGDWIKVVR